MHKVHGRTDGDPRSALLGLLSEPKSENKSESFFHLSLSQPPEHSHDQACRVLAAHKPGLSLHAGPSGHNWEGKYTIHIIKLFINKFKKSVMSGRIDSREQCLKIPHEWSLWRGRWAPRNRGWSFWWKRPWGNFYQRSTYFFLFFTGFFTYPK